MGYLHISLTFGWVPVTPILSPKDPLKKKKTIIFVFTFIEIFYFVVVVLFDLYSLRFFFRIQAHMYVVVFVTFLEFYDFFLFCIVWNVFFFFVVLLIFLNKDLVTVLIISCIAWMTKRPAAENVLGLQWRLAFLFYSLPRLCELRLSPPAHLDILHLYPYICM